MAGRVGGEGVRRVSSVLRRHTEIRRQDEHDNRNSVHLGVGGRVFLGVFFSYRDRVEIQRERSNLLWTGYVQRMSWSQRSFRKKKSDECSKIFRQYCSNTESKSNGMYTLIYKKKYKKWRMFKIARK